MYENTRQITIQKLINLFVTGFCVMGDFTTHAPNDLAINAVKSLIDCGVKLGKITHNYVLKGHRDVGQTACPGDKLYALIKTWPHYHH